MYRRADIELPARSDYEIHIWTDGSANNMVKGPIGIACIVSVWDGKTPVNTYYAWEQLTTGVTSPYAEMMAIGLGLDTVPVHINGSVFLYTDSEWAVKIIKGEYRKSKFHFEWDIVEGLANRFNNITWKHISGHNGIRNNEICDRIAHHARLGIMTVDRLKGLIGE